MLSSITKHTPDLLNAVRRHKVINHIPDPDSCCCLTHGFFTLGMPHALVERNIIQMLPDGSYKAA